MSQTHYLVLSAFIVSTLAVGLGMACSKPQEPLPTCTNRGADGSCRDCKGYYNRHTGQCDDQPPGGKTPPRGDDPDKFWQYGATTELRLDRAAGRVFQQLADKANLSTNSVDAIFLNLDITPVVEDQSVGEQRFSGALSIGYHDDDSQWGRAFQEVIASTFEGDATAAQYNRWVQHGNEHYLKLFFEFGAWVPYLGALVFVGRVVNDLDEMEGRLYYLQPDYSRCDPANTHPWPGCKPPVDKHCWEITYLSRNYRSNWADCRTFLVLTGETKKMENIVRVDPASSIWPSRTTRTQSYQILGRFSELVISDTEIDIP